MTRTSGPTAWLGTLLWAGIALLAGGCAGGGTGSGVVLGPNPQSSVSPTGSPQPTAAAPQAASRIATAPTAHSLTDVESWAEPAAVPSGPPSPVQAALTAQPAPLLILDPLTVAAATGTDPKRDPLAALHQAGHRHVLALLSVAEITPTSPVWQPTWVDARGKLSPSAPSWLGPGAPKTPDTHPVQFWDADWQKTLDLALDTLVTAGYDGVCLQGVGAYTRDAKARPTAATDMAAFVAALAARARKTDPGFSVLTDGGVALPAALTAAQSRDYLAAVDGVVARDVFYPGDKPLDNELAPDETLVAALDAFQKAGKPVFVTERLTDSGKIADFLTRVKAKGYIPDARLAVPAPPTSPPTPAPTPPQVADVR